MRARLRRLAWRLFGWDAGAEWMKGYTYGFGAGKANVEAKWLGNLTGKGPYANYPVPRSREDRDDG